MEGCCGNQVLTFLVNDLLPRAVAASQQLGQEVAVSARQEYDGQDEGHDKDLQRPKKKWRIVNVGKKLLDDLLGPV